MLMMLALRLAEYVQSLCRIAPPAGVVPRPGDRRERWKGNTADADDARVAAHTSNRWVELLHLLGAFQGQEIVERGGKEMQLMLMMLALRLAEYVQSLGRIAPPAGGVPRPGDRRERWKGNAADADDAAR